MQDMTVPLADSLTVPQWGVLLALWKDVDRLEHWAVINEVKFGKMKFSWMLHLGLRNAGHKYKWVKELLESSKDLGVLVGIKHSKNSPSKRVIIPLYSVLVLPHLEYSTQFWATQFKKDP